MQVQRYIIIIIIVLPRYEYVISSRRSTRRLRAPPGYWTALLYTGLSSYILYKPNAHHNGIVVRFIHRRVHSTRTTPGLRSQSSGCKCETTK